MMIVYIKQNEQEDVICFMSLLFVIRIYEPSNLFVEIG